MCLAKGTACRLRYAYCMELILKLGLSLTLGLLIGTERGWHERTAAEGARPAGIRTFGLIGLLGGLSALLASQLGALTLGLVFLGLSGVLVVGHLQVSRIDHDVGITTIIAGLVTFVLGALVFYDYETLATAGAVITAILLSLKPVLHRWLTRIQPDELYATLKMLLISVVLLPVLPNRGFGPWQALNPYEIWWMVVLITGISFVAYVSMRLLGANRAILLTSLFGGLASSTATTVSLARIGRDQAGVDLLAAGVMLTTVTMFLRMLLVLVIINPSLAMRAAWPLLAMAVVTAIGCLYFLYRERGSAKQDSDISVNNPFQILPALQFGMLLVVITLLAEAARHWLGEPGLFAAAGLAGLVDVDAINLTLARMEQVGLTTIIAVQGIALVAMVNTLVKGLWVAVIAGRRMSLVLLPWLALTALTGGLVAFVL